MEAQSLNVCLTKGCYKIEHYLVILTGDTFRAPTIRFRTSGRLRGIAFHETIGLHLQLPTTARVSVGIDRSESSTPVL